MSVALEKRRKVAELENFERRIFQEKQRLLSELESLERPFRKALARGWTEGFSNDIAGEQRARVGAGASRAPAWFYVVAAIILFGGGGLAAHFAWKGGSAPRADGATLRQAETPTTPARIARPAPASAKETAQADVGPAAAPAVSVAPDVVAPPAPPISDSKDIKQRLLEAQIAAAPLPEPLPPPLPKAQTLDPAPAQEAEPVAALADAQPQVGIERAAPAEAADPAASPRAAVASRTEEKPANEGRRTQCLVKVDGSVLFDRGCTLRQPSRSTVTFDAGSDDVVLTLERGRTWTASLGGRSLGKVYRTGACWGRRREVYICAKGA